MAVLTDLPYCLMYPNIYSTTVPHEDRHYFNVKSSPPRLHTHACICHALLQHADLSEAHTWKYHGSCLVIPRGAQYSCLLPKITMPHNHWVLLLDLHMGEPFPLVLVGDFQLEDNIFPRMPGDSLLYNSDNLAKLHRMRFQVTTHWTEQTSTGEQKEEKSQSSCRDAQFNKQEWRTFQIQREVSSGPLTKDNHRLSKQVVLMPQQALPTHPPSKEHHGSCDKDSHSSKHWDLPPHGQRRSPA